MPKNIQKTNSLLTVKKLTEDKAREEQKQETKWC